MANTNSNWVKFLMVIGALAVASGVYFIFQKEYIEGIAAMAAGLLLIFQNIKVIKNRKEE